ncbi:MAG TPA: hypothetical protein VNU01_01095 [Egibacteraceae bacterium]|nr:hypothetical protein [Egibacteraceae bacterium]
MAKAGTMLRRGAAEARARKAKVNAGMAVRDSAKAAAHAAAGLAQTVRDEAADRAGELSEATRRGSHEAMLRVGDWVMTPAMADRLGLKAHTRRAGIMGALLGVAAGLLVGMMLGRRNGQPQQATWADPESLAPPLGRGQVDPAATAEAQREAAGDPHTTVTA